MGATAVALGAYGSHRTYPKDSSTELKPIFEIANRYHFFHSLALITVPLCRNPKLVSNYLIFLNAIFLLPFFRRGLCLFLGQFYSQGHFITKLLLEMINFKK